MIRSIGTCPACGAECVSQDDRVSADCTGCGFPWVEIEAAERCVDRVGRALGVDTKTIHEDAFRKAMNAALGEMADPCLTDDKMEEK